MPEERHKFIFTGNHMDQLTLEPAGWKITDEARDLKTATFTLSQVMDLILLGMMSNRVSIAQVKETSTMTQIQTLKKPKK